MYKTAVTLTGGRQPRRFSRFSFQAGIDQDAGGDGTPTSSSARSSMRSGPATFESCGPYTTPLAALGRVESQFAQHACLATRTHALGTCATKLWETVWWRSAGRQ